MKRLLYIVISAIVLAASVAPAADAAKPRTAQKAGARKKAASRKKAAPAKARTAGDVRREQRRTAGDIEKTQKQISSNTRETRRQLNRLASLDAEISRNEASIATMQRRADSLGKAVEQLADSITRMEARVGAMRQSYARSLRAMRARRTQVSPIAFVLGAGSISQAWRRARYLRELSSAHSAKASRLRAQTDSLAVRREALAALHQRQREELGRMAVARTVLRDKQLRADTLVASLRREGASLKRALAEKRKLAQALDSELDRIIAEEQRKAEEQRRREEEARAKAAAEAARAKAKAEADAKARAEATAGGTASPAPSAPAASKPKPEAAPASTMMNTAAAERALSGSFQSNKGRLLFPVAGSYRIVSGFGRTEHPRIPGVQVQNSGIDIEAAGSAAHARAVFDGTVTSVFRIDGYQNIVILRHGEYLTVYAGLDRIDVRKGDKVKASQRLGHIYSDPDDGGRSVLHFELRHEKQKLNPAEWVKP